MSISNTNITINVSNLDKSVSFYLSIGFTLLNRWDNYYAQLSAPGIIIGLHPTESQHLKGSSGNVSIGFTTEDFEKTKSQLLKLTIIITERQEEGGHFLHFDDPDGTSLYFMKPITF
jgi:catechol 2,3-dioxygenase-like lactoylglutathione lyase family enzyme